MPNDGFPNLVSIKRAKCSGHVAGHPVHCGSCTCPLSNRRPHRGHIGKAAIKQITVKNPTFGVYGVLIGE